MNLYVKFSGVVCLCLTLYLFTPEQVLAQEKQRPVDIVLCVDMSGSTTGVVERLKESFFEIVNSSYSMEPVPDLRIAVVGFARPSFLSSNSFVKVISDLNNDFDTTAAILLKIRPFIEKGDQMVGAAVNTCLNKLEWSKDKNAVKIICLIGNGNVNMGTSAFLQTACETAKKRHIIINTFYCMSNLYALEIAGWKVVADLCDGKSYEVDVNKREPFAIPIPQELITNMNNDFNNSFIYYTYEGAVNTKRILHLDQEFSFFSLRSFNSWMLYKSSDIYLKNTYKWDLVSYSNNPNFDLIQVDKKQLPKEYYKVAGPEMMKILSRKTTERAKAIGEFKSTLLPFSAYSANSGKAANTDYNENYFATAVVYSIVKSLQSFGFKPPPVPETQEK